MGKHIVGVSCYYSGRITLCLVPM